MPRSLEELRDRLLRLRPGEFEILSRDRFDAAFASLGTEDARKAAAINLGEQCGSRVLFVGTDRVFVRFARSHEVSRIALVAADRLN
jgi:hypothetical protein